MSAGLLAFLIALSASLVLTVPVRALALRVGMVDLPGPRKVHLKPIPLLGGLAIYLGVMLAVFSVFDGPGYYRANRRAYKLQDGRTAADICRGVKRCTTPLPVGLAMLVFCISTPLGERRLAFDNHLPWLVGGNSQEPPHEVAQIAKRFGVEISERSVARIPNERSFRRVPGTRRVTRLLPAL